MVAKAERSGGDAAAESHNSSRRSRSFNNKPSWLLCCIADLDDRMKILLPSKTSKENSGSTADSFAVRANSYYHERPQLLALLQDLYNSYLSLADRYCQALAKKDQRPSRSSSPIAAAPLKFDDLIADEGADNGEVIDSDAESSLSFQPPVVSLVQAKETCPDIIIAELVMKSVECELILSELNAVEKKSGEASRKMELQRSLLDVLDSERLILLNDNATLGYRVNALAEENKGLVSESLFLKRKAAELARCMLQTREDHRVCVLSRKIEDLQGQIHGLEKRNKEYYERIMRQEEKNKKVTRKSEVSLEDCLQAQTGNRGGFDLLNCLTVNRKRMGSEKESERSGCGVEGGGYGRVWKVWDKVKKLDLVFCGPHLDSDGC